MLLLFGSPVWVDTGRAANWALRRELAAGSWLPDGPGGWEAVRVGGSSDGVGGDAVGTRPDGDGSSEWTAEVHREVERLRAEAARQVARADRRAHLWATVEIVLGLPAALLAAVSGAAGLATANARVPAGILALISAGLSAGVGFLRSDRRRVANKRSRRAWAAVEADAVLVLVRAAHLDRDGLERALRSLFDKRQTALAAYEEDTAESNR